MIVFRSRYGIPTSIGHSLKKTPLSHDEWSDIGLYTPYDESRDIVWKKFTTDTTYAKKRNTESLIRLIFWISRDRGDDFWTEGSPTSRSEWKARSKKMLEFSAMRGGYQYETLEGSFSTIQYRLRSRQTKNHLIILLGNLGERELMALRTLGITNDLVIVHPYHPWEKNPDASVMLQGKVFDAKKYSAYQSALTLHESTTRKTLATSQSEAIFTTTDRPIQITLNHCFKYRYARG